MACAWVHDGDEVVMVWWGLDNCMCIQQFGGIFGIQIEITDIADQKIKNKI